MRQEALHAGDPMAYRPHGDGGSDGLVKYLEAVSRYPERNRDLIESLVLELELRGVPVWRCDGCDRWLADTPTAHINHSADCEANGR